MGRQGRAMGENWDNCNRTTVKKKKKLTHVTAIMLLVVFRFLTMFVAQADLGSFSNSMASPPTPWALTFHSWGLQVGLGPIIP